MVREKCPFRLGHCASHFRFSAGFSHVVPKAALLDGTFEFKDTDKVNAIFAKYPATRRQAAIIPLLHLAQSQTGFLNRGAIETVARLTNSQFGRVHETATFYHMFRFKPPCKHVLERCNGLSCFVTRGDQFKAAIEKAVGGTFKEGKSSDGEFTLEEVECLGACASAPVVIIDGVYYPTLKEQNIAEIIRRIKSGEDATEFSVTNSPQPKPATAPK
jgi:NADH:ubiquinone oxidoreductase subunit E